MDVGKVGGGGKGEAHPIFEVFLCVPLLSLE